MPTPTAGETGCLRRRFARALVRTAATLALWGCALAPRSATEAARIQFSDTHYCPLRRVAARDMTLAPLPPPRIAADPERLRMWNRKAARRFHARHRVEVRGCEEEGSYSCWEYRGYTSRWRHRGERMSVVGAVCNAESGEPVDLQPPGE